MRGTKGGQETTEFEIQHFIKHWLKNSSDRHGGRERRRLPRADLEGDQNA